MDEVGGGPSQPLRDAHRNVIEIARAPEGSQHEQGVLTGRVAAIREVVSVEGLMGWSTRRSLSVADRSHICLAICGQLRSRSWR
jgi:hypothetical protein